MRSRTKIWLAGVAVVIASGPNSAWSIGGLPTGGTTAPAALIPDPNKSPALCGSADTPETGIQGDLPGVGGANCGLTFLSQLPSSLSGAVQGAGHCAYVRNSTGLYGTNGVMKAFSLADPVHPVQTDEEPLYGGTESFRTQVAGGRAILVAGRGVWDITNCEDLVFKGEIQWPSTNSRNGANIAGTSSHELAISHDARKVYSGLGFAVAYLDNLEDPSTWRVYNHTCAIGRQAGYPLHAGTGPTLCDVAPEGDYAPQYSHSSDDNLEGTRWYGANQNGDMVSQLEPSTLRVVDISVRGNPVVLDSLAELPGHSMDWWRSPDGREYVMGANEAAPGNTCQAHPRSTALGNSADGYIAEVTNDDLKHASRVSLMINEPQNCAARALSGSNAAITEATLYNKHGAAMLMVQFGDPDTGAGLRVFDVRDGYHPKEVAYFNTGGHVHSGRFYYDDTRGIVLTAASAGMQVLELQPQVITALGLPTPTDPAYPRYPNGRPAKP